MKILIVRVSSMGDVLHNMPVASDLRREFPHAQIDWVVEEAFVHLVKRHRGVNRIVSYAQRRWRKNLGSAATWREIRQFWRDLRAHEYDLILDTQGLFKTGIIMGMARCAAGGLQWGLANGTEGSGYESISRLFHDHSVPVPVRTHAVLRGRLVAAAAGGYAMQDQARFCLRAPEVKPDCLPTSPYVALFHATAGAAKKWAVENWHALGNEFIDLGLTPVLPWGNEKEKIAAQEIAAGIPNAIVLPKLSMDDAIACAYFAHLVIGVDTGLTHIAAAYERPTIEIYCASPRWKTEGNWSNQIINLGDMNQAPDPSDVISAIRQLFTVKPSASA